MLRPPPILHALFPIPASPSPPPPCCPLQSGVVRRRRFLVAHYADVNPFAPWTPRTTPVISVAFTRLEKEGSCLEEVWRRWVSGFVEVVA